MTSQSAVTSIQAPVAVFSSAATVGHNIAVGFALTCVSAMKCCLKKKGMEPRPTKWPTAESRYVRAQFLEWKQVPFLASMDHWI